MVFAYSVVGSPDQVAAQIGYYLNGLAQANRLLMREQPIPHIYHSGVTYAVEASYSSVQQLTNCLEAWRQGFIECKGAAAWLLACYREQQPSEDLARLYDIDVTWKERAADPLGRGLVPKNGIVRIYHARVRLPDGTIEDPTKRMQKRAA